MGDRSDDNHAPRPTIGHHFGSLLQCTQKAWLDYHGDRKLRAKPPGFLGKLQQEGIEHERRICETLYPDAIVISEGDSPETCAERTIDAMKSGAPAILQPYFLRSDGRGIADVIEHVRPSEASETGHVYRIGEFKRATSLSTAHVLQVAWYDELLRGIQRDGCDDAFFILGDMRRKQVLLSDIRDSFENCKHQLWQLRDATEPPEPHLCRWCISCQWRDVCVPQLMDRNDVSLLPGVTRRLAKNLSSAGITTWQRVVELDNHSLERLGFDWRELSQLRLASERLERGEAVLRYAIKSDELRQLTAISIEFVPNYVGPDGYPVPQTVWVESANGPQAVPVGTDESVWPETLNAVSMLGG